MTEPRDFVAALLERSDPAADLCGRCRLQKCFANAGSYDRLPALMADLVRHRVAVIATPGSSGSGCHNPPINSSRHPWKRVL
jgi:hypothetical protein